MLAERGRALCPESCYGRTVGKCESPSSTANYKLLLTSPSIAGSAFCYQEMRGKIQWIIMERENRRLLPCILSRSDRSKHGGKGAIIWVHKGARIVSLVLSSMPGNGTTEAGVPR